MVKMLISGAPVYFSHLDKSLMNAVIMQLESENNNGDEAGKGNIKFADHKLMFYTYRFDALLVFLDSETMVRFAVQAKRYFHPFHPSVLTPPPNLA